MSEFTDKLERSTKYALMRQSSFTFANRVSLRVQKMTNMMNFVIAGQQRTGSTMLVRTLDQHPNICCRGRIVHPELSKQDTG